MDCEKRNSTKIREEKISGMNQGTKIVIVAGTTGLFWWMRSRLPKIKVLQILPGPAIVYEMSVAGDSITDTFYQGDQRQVVPAEDGKHFFVADPTPTGVTLSILKVKNQGGFDLKATGYMAYDYAGNDLPVRIAAPGVGLTLFEIAI